MSIDIYRIDKNLPLPKYETPGSFAFDFLAREETTVAPQSIGLIPGNVIITCPDDLALFVLPRSSMPRKKQLVFPHSIGLIDADYHGEKDEICIQVYNISSKKVVIQKGERIAQGLFVKTEKRPFREIDSPKKNISRGGFGSTG